MIVYNLICSNGHDFEDWFDNMADYDAKAEGKALECPECGDKQVSKALMAPSIGGKASTPAPACGAPACANMGCPAQRA